MNSNEAIRRVNHSDIEIMAPAGNFESLNAAIQGGANSVYFGVGTLNMRSHSANNFTADSLKEIVDICKKARVKSYLTLNIVIYDQDVPAMREAIDKAVEAGVSAIIASDMSVILYARERGIEVHISTQLNVSNILSLRYHAQFADVIVLARELNLNQIREISDTIEREQIKGPSGELIKLELFCHGALCMAVSGKCYLSLHEYNASANRGNCYQICRRSYEVKDKETGNTLEVDNKYIMSPKDLSTILFVDKIIDSGIRVFKIEGRARAPEYVKRVTSAYREAADAVCEGRYTPELAKKLEEGVSEVFNRGFWDGYYQGAKLGEWSEVYGNKATKKKIYVGKVTNFFSNLSVAEVLIEAGEIRKGDEILIIGTSTGVIEYTVGEIRTNLEPVEVAVKGEFCSLPISEGVKLRRSDKIYLWR